MLKDTIHFRKGNFKTTVCEYRLLTTMLYIRYETYRQNIQWHLSHSLVSKSVKWMKTVETLMSQTQFRIFYKYLPLYLHLKLPFKFQHVSCKVEVKSNGIKNFCVWASCTKFHFVHKKYSNVLPKKILKQLNSWYFSNWPHSRVI
jgi:hypothetical protein